MCIEINTNDEIKLKIKKLHHKWVQLFKIITKNHHKNNK